MIQPISRVSYYSNYQIRQSKIENQVGLINNNTELSGYNAGQAILSRSNISFKEREKLVPLTIMYDKELKTDNVEICYSYKSSKRNDTLAYYTGMLMLFLTTPFHKDVSKKNKDGKIYLSLITSVNDYNLKTYGECYEKQKQSMQAIYDTNFETTIESMKNIDTKIQNENYANGLIDKKTKEENLEIIKSITSQDVREFMKNVLINNRPVFAIKN